MVANMFLDKVVSKKALPSKGEEHLTRSMLKAISWRVIGTLDTVLLAWLITGELGYASMIGGAELFTKMALYIGHERLWNKINWGKND